MAHQAEARDTPVRPPPASEGTQHPTAGGEMRADNFRFAFETDLTPDYSERKMCAMCGRLRLHARQQKPSLIDAQRQSMSKKLLASACLTRSAPGW